MNIPHYEVLVIENGAVIHRNRVVVGKEETPTPIFSDKMQFLIVNPYWNVPPSIIRKEMLPKAAGDPNYFRRLGYGFLRAGHLVVRQPPGERNSLSADEIDVSERLLGLSARYAVTQTVCLVEAGFQPWLRAGRRPFHFAESVLGKGWS